MNVRVGIGSWADDVYREVLYPAGVPKSERLRAYAEKLPHVEVNASYYAVPKPETVETWLRQTPPDFTFA